MSKIDSNIEKKLFIDYIPDELFEQNKKQPKPPLGITPKHIYELQRIQEITRALYEYSRYVNSIYSCELMINWSEELNERLNHLKYDMEDNENRILK